MDNNKGITIDFAEKYKNLICDDIPKFQLKSYPHSTPAPKKYIKKFVHTEESFAYKYCMSEEEQAKVRKARKKTLNSDNK